jgi:hypothetical protein
MKVIINIDVPDIDAAGARQETGHGFCFIQFEHGTYAD